MERGGYSLKEKVEYIVMERWVGPWNKRIKQKVRRGWVREPIWGEISKTECHLSGHMKT